MPTTNPTTEEIWKAIEGYEGLYEISSHGRVKSLCGVWGHPRKHPIIRKLLNHDCGYVQIGLCKSGTQISRFVHQLVAEAFIGKRPNGMDVNHKDAVKSHNHFSNLEYVTRKENIRHSALFGLQQQGETHHAHKVTEAQVREIRSMKGIYKQRDIADMFGISQAAAWAILNRKTWRHVS